jgi:hypothetical protein
MEAQLNITKSIWIDEQQLGTVLVLRHRGKKVQHRLPANIENSVTLRFKGHGKTRDNQTGALMLAVKIDRGLNRFVDLLVFLHQLGEFQLRVARKYKLAFGYFNQEIFERMHVILQRKNQT